MKFAPKSPKPKIDNLADRVSLTALAMRLYLGLGLNYPDHAPILAR